MDSLLPNLRLVKLDWSMLAAPADRVSTSWRIGLDACLIRRDLLQRVGGIDPAFTSLAVAGLDLGLRFLKYGGVVEHRPELCTGITGTFVPSPPREDLYTFLIRHHGDRWARYVRIRRVLAGAAPWHEASALRRARSATAAHPAPRTELLWSMPQASAREELAQVPVSVIIPTLGRYPYLPEALESLRRQTVRPREVVVVDQNPPEARQPEVYQGYEDLGLRVIWQDERGQSLARNTAFAAVVHPYVFLFDDDSVAQEDLIETHLRAVLDGRFDVSTGVAYPPPPSDYRLPPDFTYPRLSQTFDTGNALVPLRIIREMGGLDRNYDFGPGTDTDFGTRLYLAGYRILHNPAAVRIHYKAPMGGLRVHGAHKYNTDAGLLEPFPPITQTYYASRYFDPRARRERVLLQYFTSQFPPQLRRADATGRARLRALAGFAAGGILLPLKWMRSRRRAAPLLERGPRLADFGAGSPEPNSSENRSCT
jgi:GT2 family glycosyltransferase